MAKLLLVDDDTELLGVLGEWLQIENFTVEAAETGEDALSRLKHYEYDVVILDMGLPDIDGSEVCRRYRSNGGMLPVLMLTGKSGIQDKTLAFEAGADDYLTKPFHPQELTSRIKAMLRRPRFIVPEKLVFSGVEVNLGTRHVMVDGMEVRLLPQEFSLLEFFLRNPNRVFSPEEIMAKAWSNEKDTAVDTVRVHINKLRKKLDTGNGVSFIRNVHGHGYIFDRPAG